MNGTTAESMLETSNINEYFTKEECSIAYTVINRHYHYLISKYYDDLWSISYYAIWKARETYNENGGKKYSSWVYTFIKRELYSFVLSINTDKRKSNELTESFGEIREKKGISDKRQDEDCLELAINDNIDFELMFKEAESHLTKQESFILNSFIMGISQKEIAKELGISSEAVRQRKVKLVKKMTDYIDINI